MDDNHGHDSLEKVTGKKSGAATKGNYMALNSKVYGPEEYQLPSVTTSYMPYPGRTEISDELKLLTRRVRNLKIIVGCGGVILFFSIAVAMATITSVTFGIKSDYEYQIHQQVYALKENITQLHTPRRISAFDKCLPISATCAATLRFTDFWYYCETWKLSLDDEVSITQCYCVIIKTTMQHL